MNTACTELIDPGTFTGRTVDMEAVRLLQWLNNPTVTVQFLEILRKVTYTNRWDSKAHNVSSGSFTPLISRSLDSLEHSRTYHPFLSLSEIR